MRLALRPEESETESVGSRDDRVVDQQDTRGEGMRSRTHVAWQSTDREGTGRARSARLA
jgi:hypothetical protein